MIIIAATATNGTNQMSHRNKDNFRKYKNRE